MKFVVLDIFECAADACPDDCCHGWRIDVDERTRIAWQDLPQTPLTGKIHGALLGEAGEFHLQRRDDGRCTFLVDGLCEIQKNLGHGLIPQTCRDYPRVAVGRASAPIASAYLSCPEIVRLLLELPDEAELFVATESGEIGEGRPSRFDSRYIEKLFDRLINDLLRHPRSTVGDVLYHCAVILSGLLVRTSFERTVRQLEELQDNSEEQTRLIASTRKAFRKRQLNTGREQAGRFWHVVMSLCRVCHEPDWQDAVTRAGLAPVADAPGDPRQIDSHVRQLWRKTGELPPFVQSSMKRYLKVKLVNHGFPLAVHQNELIQTFLECGIATMQILYLTRLRALDGTVTQADMETIIYKVERAMVHNDKIEDVLNRNPELESLDSYAALFLQER
ncbi:MAG: flagellin lysine-N-methylase [Thiohalophilus sp.]